MKPIAIKPAHKGLLRAKLHTPPGKTIPPAKLAAAKQSPDPATRKQATFAKNAATWNKL